MKIRAFALALILISAGLSTAEAGPALHALVAAYPEFLAGHHERAVIWKDGRIVWKNRIRPAIGEIFERNGFIRGAKWYHFDSMHFEYRPELIALARAGLPR